MAMLSPFITEDTLSARRRRQIIIHHNVGKGRRGHRLVVGRYYWHHDVIVVMTTVLLFLTLYCLVAASTAADGEQQQKQQEEEQDQGFLPMNDKHFSSHTQPLPPFLADASECTCENPRSRSRPHFSPRSDGAASTDTTTCGVFPQDTDTNISNNNDNTNNNNNKKKTNKMARIFYLIVVHNERTLNDAVLLFRSLRYTKTIIVIHIDLKLDYNKYFINSILHQEIQACPCGSIVDVASIYNSSWSTWSMNLPTLWGIEQAVTKFSGKWDIFINLSGDSLPVYTAQCMGQKLYQLAVQFPINYVTSSSCETGLQPTPISYFPPKWHKRTHYSHQPASLNYIEEVEVKEEYNDDDKKKKKKNDGGGETGTVKQKKIYHTNVTLETYFGSQWMILQPDFCHYLIQELKRSDSLPSQFREYLIQTKKLMSDETFIPTLIMYLFPETIPPVNTTDSSLLLPTFQQQQQQRPTTSSSTTTTTTFRSRSNDNQHYHHHHDVPKIYSIRYERMDEHVPSSHGYYPIHQRYQVPTSSGVDQPKPWGPYFLGVYDLQSIQESGALFIRKVSRRIDPNLYNVLPVDHADEIPNIGWPKEIEVSPVPDWEKTLQDLKEKYYKKQQQEELLQQQQQQGKNQKNTQTAPPSEYEDEDVDEDNADQNDQGVNSSTDDSEEEEEEEEKDDEEEEQEI